MLPAIKSGVRTLNEDHRIPLPEGGRHLEEAYLPGQILGNYFHIANKASGVEPGFLAICIDTDVEFRNYIIDQHIDKQEGFDLLKDQYLKDHQDTPADKVETEVIKTWLMTHYAKAAQIAADLQKDDPPNKQRFTRYLIKQDYTDQGKDGKVTMPLRRALNTNTIKGLPKPIRILAATAYQSARKRPTAEENRNALLECIGNDIASRAHGMQCQEQTVIFGTYPDGKLKILTRGTWDYGIEPLGKVRGGDKKAGGNYLSVEVAPGKKPSRLSDQSITDLGEYFALMITQGDVDAIGSQAQNKFKKNGKLFGLDFGQVYRKPSPIIDTLEDDFSFKNKGFKNFSIFEDTPLREKMKGIHIIRKLLTGEDPPDDVLDGYGAEFKNKIKSIEQGADLAIFDEYTKQLVKLSNDAWASKPSNPSLASEYDDLIVEIARSKANAINTHLKIVKKFESRLSLTPQQLDILDSIEKLTSDTSLTSPDGTVLLNQMRITKNRAKWEMKVENGKCILTLDPPKWYQIGKSKVIRKKLEAYAKTGLIDINSTKGLVVSFNKSDIKQVADIFNETSIQQHKHQEEVKSRETLRQLKDPDKKQATVRISLKPTEVPTKAVAKDAKESSKKEEPVAKSDSSRTILTALKTPTIGPEVDISATPPDKTRRLSTSMPKTEIQPPMPPSSKRRDSAPPFVRRHLIEIESIPYKAPSEEPVKPPPSPGVQLEVDRQHKLLEEAPLQKMQKYFKENQPEESNIVLLTPHSHFAAREKLDADTIIMSTRNHSIVISRYDEKAIELVIGMLCNSSLDIKPEDIKVSKVSGTALTGAQIEKIDEIKAKVAPTLPTSTL